MTNVALNDAGQVTFGYGTGTAALSFAAYAKYHWRTWQNGQLGADQSINCCVLSGTVSDHQEYNLYGISVLTGAGQAYGVKLTKAWEDPQWELADGYLYSPDLGCFGPPSPPYLNEGAWEAFIDASSQSGVIAGSMYDDPVMLPPDDDGNPQGGDLCNGGYVYKDGNFTFFDGESDYSDADTLSVTIVPDTVLPSAVNDNGWVVGTGLRTLPYTLKYWHGGRTAQVISEDAFEERAVGLNNQGQIILASCVGPTKKGSLWENGERVTLVDHVPASLKEKIKDIQPFSISNQTNPAAGPDRDATIYILAKATVNGTADSTIVCTRNNDGNWSYEQVSLPSNVSYVNFIAINSSGELAFTWYDNDDSNKTFSASAQAVRPAQTPEPTPQPAQTSSGKKKAGIAPRLVLTFNTTKPEAADDQAWQAACVDFKYQYHVGVAAADSVGEVDTESWPYEYIYKIKPDNSGVTIFQNAPADMAIYEDNFYRLYLYRNGMFLTSNPTADKPPGHIDSNTYNPSAHFSYTNPTAPNNPTMYAFDAPDTRKLKVYKFMKDHVINRYEYSLTLLAYPIDLIARRQAGTLLLQREHEHGDGF